MSELKIKKLNDNARIDYPKRKGDAGFDIWALVSIESEDILTGRRQVTFYTGICIEPPKPNFLMRLFGFIYEADFRCRSSIHKSPFRLTNGLGTIDSSYRGEITAVFDIIGDLTPSEYKAAIKEFMSKPIGQLVFIKAKTNFKFNYVDELSETDRGEGGYGSTNQLNF